MAVGAIADGTVAGVIVAGVMAVGAMAVGDTVAVGGAPGSTSVHGLTTATDIIRVTATTITAITMAAPTTAATAIAVGTIADGAIVTGAIVDGTAAGVIAVGATGIGAVGRTRFGPQVEIQIKEAARAVLPSGPLLLCAVPDRASCNTATLLAWSAATLSRQGNQ